MQTLQAKINVTPSWWFRADVDRRMVAVRAAIAEQPDAAVRYDARGLVVEVPVDRGDAVQTIERIRERVVMAITYYAFDAHV